MRDIQSYSEIYNDEIDGFESIKVEYRRRHVLEVIDQYKPKHILEIGCGLEPLFRFWGHAEYTIVEPADIFVQNILSDAKYDCNSIHVIQGFMGDPDVQLQLVSTRFNMIICSGLLHEVEKPERILTNIRELCDDNTIVYVVVPNAESLHRLLGVKLGIIQDSHDMTDKNVRYQQNTNFDMPLLRNMMIKNGFTIVSDGGVFIKPFSHEQMYSMLKNNIIDSHILDGLYELGRSIPEYASEIYSICRVMG